MSKDAKNVPALRFKGYSDAWEKRKLGEVTTIFAGGDIDKERLNNTGKYPVISNALTRDGIVGYYEDYKVHAPAVTVTGRGDVGHARSRHTSYTPIVRLLTVQSKSFDSDFLASVINNTNILVESTGVPQLTSPQLGSYHVSFPLLTEQRKIGQFITVLEDLIAATQSRLSSLESLKKSLLQDLFI
ncbi:restriction endonuclease subunit S [Lacticaseibacillus paracasei]|uniref:restriction endonuclease subunit S n=1 Tax=Lacticaseibacillus paracasei TaxID=1597 RepID=UPI00272CC497|nr:restriction endonuclease subunit S [Lacticaseibacillus paracasei]WKZ95521.1 restriction endonuclease subunit S [Lacticaseibacillus paracasei]